MLILLYSRTSNKQYACALLFAVWLSFFSCTLSIMAIVSLFRYENPLVDPPTDGKKPRSMSQESGSVSDKSDGSTQSRRKTSPASFMNNSYQGNNLRRSSIQVSEPPRNAEVVALQNSLNPKTELMRTGSEQSVNSLCSDEAYDQQLETLIESTKEEGQRNNGKSYICFVSNLKQIWTVGPLKT